MNHSIKKNVIFNLISSIMGIIFPLVTFPYVSRIFGVETLGGYNFSKNYVEIFACVAMLGIPTYAAREGARVRDNRENISEFNSEMFSFSMMSSLLVIVLLFISSFSSTELEQYKYLILLFSLTIPMASIGMSWLFVIFEDYTFSTILSVLTNVLSMLLMFAFVHTKNDVYTYALITILASSGANIIRYCYAKKYCDTCFTLNIHFKKHLKPILLLFSAYLSVMIYNKTDTYLLGVFCGDYSVGIYSVSTKVYNLVKSCLLSITSVLQTRAVVLCEKNNSSETLNYLQKSFNTLVIFVVPCMVGMAFMSDDIIEFIAGKEFSSANISMIILSISLFFALFSTSFSSCVLIPQNLEKITLYGAIAGAVINLVLNLFFIPNFQENGAALTTLIAELAVFLYYWYFVRKYYPKIGMVKNLVKTIISSSSIIIVLYLLRDLACNIIIRVIIKVSLSGMMYGLVQLIIKNEIILDFKKELLLKLKTKCY